MPNKINLPHTRESKAGANMFEPVIPSQFHVYLIPPAGVANAPILTEHVKNITGMFIENGGESSVEQYYQTAKRSYDSNEKETVYNITITFTLNLDDANQNYVYEILKAWSRKKYNPMTGERGLKKDYVGSIVGIKYNRDGSIFWERTAHQAYINSNLSDLQGDYGSHEPQELEVTFRADFVTDGV